MCKHIVYLSLYIYLTGCIFDFTFTASINFAHALSKSHMFCFFLLLKYFQIETKANHLFIQTYSEIANGLAMFIIKKKRNK